MTTASNIQHNKIIAKNWFEYLRKGNIEAISRITAPTWKMQGDLRQGVEGMKKLLSALGPIDQQWTLEEVIAEGDRVVLRATNDFIEESFLGLSSNGRRQSLTVIFIHQIVYGKIMESWRFGDDFTKSTPTRSKDRMLQPMTKFLC